METLNFRFLESRAFQKFLLIFELQQNTYILKLSTMFHPYPVIAKAPLEDPTSESVNIEIECWFDSKSCNFLNEADI